MYVYNISICILHGFYKKNMSTYSGQKTELFLKETIGCKLHLQHTRHISHTCSIPSQEMIVHSIYIYIHRHFKNACFSCTSIVVNLVDKNNLCQRALSFKRAQHSLKRVHSFSIDGTPLRPLWKTLYCLNNRYSYEYAHVCICKA